MDKINRVIQEIRSKELYQREVIMSGIKFNLYLDAIVKDTLVESLDYIHNGDRLLNENLTYMELKAKTFLMNCMICAKNSKK